MLRIAGVSALILATGCLVESSGEDLTPTDMLGRVCTTDLAVTGTFVQSKAPPVHEDGTPYTGCWPIGTWSFTGTGPDGEPVQLASRNADVLRRQSDGSWRFVIDNPWGTD